MKKILAILLAAVLILGLLSACGKTTDKDGKEETEKTEEVDGKAEGKEDADAKDGEKTSDTAEKTSEEGKKDEKPEASDEKTEKEEQPTAEAGDGTTITVESVTAAAGSSVTVPVKLSGNTGLAASIITIGYDSALTLTDAARGDALASMEFTPGGDLSANPINFVWDGIEAENSNGTLVNLTFTAPKTAGEYKISVTGDPGNFFDNDMKDIPVSFVAGTITVTE